MRSRAERQSVDMVHYTCPDLDRILDDLLDSVVEEMLLWEPTCDTEVREALIAEFSAAAQKVKEQCTIPLREALIEACDEIIELQADIKEMHDALLR